MKRCSRCGIVKNKGAFSLNRKHRDGLQSWCKECYREYDGRLGNPFAPYEGDIHKHCGGLLAPLSYGREGVVMRCLACRLAGAPV